VDEGHHGLTLFYAPRVRQPGTDTNTPIEGWEVESDKIKIQKHRAGGTPATEGIAKLKLDAAANSTLYQELPTLVGGEYLLELAFSPRDRKAGPDTNDFEVWWDGTLLASLG
jgi:hypothetical protein